MADDYLSSPPSLYDTVASDQAIEDRSTDFLSDRDARIERLEQAKQRKLDLLASKRNDFASFDDSFTDLGNGYVESNKNKVWNELDAPDIQSVQAYGIGQYGLTTDDDGVLRLPNGEAYKGNTRRLYAFNTPEGAYKYGTARGDLAGSEERYTPNAEGTYGWAPGPRGVDTNQKTQDVLLPENIANLLEGLAHGRREALDARVARDIFGDPDEYNDYGSGASEYYRDREGLFGAPQEVNTARGKELLEKYLEVIGKRNPSQNVSNSRPASREERLAQIRQENQGVWADNATFGDRLANTAASFGATLVNELFVRPAEAVGDLTGAYDISGATDKVNNAFGYNPVLEQRAMEDIGKDWETVMSDDATIADKARAVMSGMFTAFTTPEMLGSSLGVIAAWSAPGGILGKLGMGSKYAAKLAQISKLEEAGKLTKNAARLQKMKAFRSAGGTTDLLRTQSGHIVAAVGNVNEQYNEFVKNNGGVELEGAEKAQWFAQRLPIQIVNQNLDKIVAIDIIKSPGLIKSLIPMAKSFTNKEFANIAKQAAKGVLVSSKSVGEEAAQEYTQTMMELFNSRYGSEAFKDQDTFKEFLSDKRNLSEAGVAAIAGAGGAGQFEVAGTLAPAVGAIGKGLGTGAVAIRDKIGKTTDSETTPETDASNAQVAADVQANAERAATSANPASAYFGAFGSDNKDARVAASEKAQQDKQGILDGTHSVFSSDATPEEKIQELKNLATVIGAEDGDADSVGELSAAMVAQVNPATEEEAALFAEEIKKAYKVGQQFASIKGMTEVEGEVSDGVRGFRTYYAQAYASLAEGDTKGYERALGELDKFYSHQQTKLNRVNAGIKSLMAKATAKAEERVRRGKAENFEEAVVQLRAEESKKAEDIAGTSSELDGKRVYHNDKRTHSTLVPYLDLYRKLASPTTYDGGIFRWVEKVQSEVAEMGKVYSALVGEIDPEPQAEEVVTPAEPQATDEMPEGELDTENLPPSPEMEAEDSIEAPPVIEDNGEYTASEEDYIGTEDYTALEEDYAVPEEDYTGTEEYDGSPEEDYDGTAVEEETTASADKKTEPREKKEKSEPVQLFEANKQALKENQAAIRARRDQITREEAATDPHLIELQNAREYLKEERNAFDNAVERSFSERVKSFTANGIEVVIQLYTHYINGVAQTPTTTTLDKLIDRFTPTGFTLSERDSSETLASTKAFAKSLRAVIANTDLDNANSYKTDPILAFLFNEDGTTNYNTVEAVQAAVYEYVMQEASSLKSGYRTDEDIAKLFGLEEDKISAELATALREGGVTLKLAAAAVGGKVMQNLGLEVKNTQNREALATSFGIMALEGASGTLVNTTTYTTSALDKANGFTAKKLRFVEGAPKLFKNLKQVRKDLNHFKDRYALDFDNERTYRKNRRAKARAVAVHRMAHQDAPKDHQDVVNRLENTPFVFNSGHEVLMSLFTKNDKLDVEALVTHILGPESNATNFDAKERYAAQKAAFIRNIEFYQEAVDDVGTGSLYFNWFIAKNHRIHLDSNRINPQGDKHLARWLLTTANSRKKINKQTVKEVLTGKSKDMDAVMFAYGIVQAFDGADGVPGIDKNSQKEILAYAKKLLDKPTAELETMALKAQHLGHAALAIANLAKYNEVGTGTFESDMVLEVDGLTNGFAFRSMQFPVASDGADITPEQWLEKVGILQENSELYSLESMNGARNKDQEDVYISVGKIFNAAVSGKKADLKNKNAKSWIKLFEKLPDGGLPDFSKNDDMVKSFVRKLMKSPVMVFNYAAGINKIAGGLIDDQIMGTNYLSGQGLIDLLTAKDDKGNYKISEKDLVDTFKDKGEIYHQARIDLAKHSLATRGKGSTNISILRKDLYVAIDALYREPLTETLETLFSKQTRINVALTNAAQFMYDHFKKEYSVWRDQNKEASDEDKTEFLRDMAMIIPGVAGASSDDQRNKVTFLKNALEETNNDVSTSLRGVGYRAANTVTRGYRDPGVGPAVLTVLALDSSVLAKSLNQAYNGEENAGALPIHDAVLLGIGEALTINTYNENFYTTNRNYSTIQEFVNAIDQLSQIDGMETSVANVGVDGKPLTFKEMQNTLTTLNTEVQNARKTLFSQNVKVGQLVGPEGTMAHINIEQKTAEAETYIQKQATAISSAMDSEKVKKAFGVQYKTIRAEVEEMLKGCK